MAMTPEAFIGVMNIWRENFLKAADLPVVGATEEQLRGRKISVCTISGNDKVHTPSAARKAMSRSLFPGRWWPTRLRSSGSRRHLQ